MTAELPTEERYEFSEVGLYSAGSNPYASSFDSRLILGFTESENWQYVSGSSTTDLTKINESLDAETNDNVINTSLKIFETNTDNKIFYTQNRSERYERCRYFNNIIVMRGDSSSLTLSGGHLQVGNNPEYVELSALSLDFSKNAPTDELRLAFSIINKDGDSVNYPDNVKILIEFSNSSDNTKYAKFEINKNNGVLATQYDLQNNRYCIAKSQLQDLYYSSGFSWAIVNTVKVYVCVTDNSIASSDFYVALDALRFENLTTSNPLYGLVGYSVIKNNDSSTIIKSSNTSNYIEFKFSMDVL